MSDNDSKTFNCDCKFCGAKQTYVGPYAESWPKARAFLESHFKCRKGAAARIDMVAGREPASEEAPR